MLLRTCTPVKIPSDAFVHPCARLAGREKIPGRGLDSMVRSGYYAYVKQTTRLTTLPETTTMDARVNMFCKLNTDGKQVDMSCAYRLVITILRGDDKGKVLERMARGTIVAYSDINDAVAAAVEFIDLAHMTRCAGHPYAVYGTIIVVHEETGNIDYCSSIMG